MSIAVFRMYDFTHFSSDPNTIALTNKDADADAVKYPNESE